MAEKTVPKTCRLCLKKELFVIAIFSDHGKEMNIKYNIEEYLKINISDNDLLPTDICYTCLANLNMVMTFTNQSKNNQNTFNIENEPCSNDSLFSELDFQCPPQLTSKPSKNVLKRRIKENFKPIAKKLCSSNDSNKLLIKPPAPHIKTISDTSEKLSDLKINNKKTERKKMILEYYKQKCNLLKNSK